MITIAKIRISNPPAKINDFMKKSQQRKREHLQWMRNNSDKIRVI